MAAEHPAERLSPDARVIAVESERIITQLLAALTRIAQGHSMQIEDARAIAREALR